MPEVTPKLDDDLEAPPPGGGGGTPLPNDLTGTSIGGCVVTRGIAVGGMGVVYEALQNQPARKVALKLLRTALATDEGLLRFEREARTLAGLRHPAIAQIFSAGTHVTASGERLPYFVMEYVPDARSLVAFASQRRLDLRSRLALLVRFCDAVHFGHTKGVIHRDLKPANLLVDGDGNPKVIDFGIARTTEDDADESTPKTETGQLVGTLPYMSPEQVLGRRADVDTRSDVYALGVILYELLTGRLPYELKGLNLVEAAAAIAFKEPLPPSRFAPETAGDLTVILQKALAKDPGERYASAASLGKDVERFLAYTPIAARPPSLGYHLRLFARRNRVGFFALVGAVAALLAAVVVSALFAASEAEQRRTAETQSQRAERLLRRSMEFPLWVLKDLDPRLADLQGSAAIRAEVAERIAADLDALMATEPEDPEILKSVAESYWTLGDFDSNIRHGVGVGNRSRALDRYAKVRTLYTRLRQLAPDDPFPRRRLVGIDLTTARALSAQSRVQEAREPLERAMKVLDEPPTVGREDDLAKMRVFGWTMRAELAWGEGRFVESLADYERILAHWNRSIPADTAEPDALGLLMRAELDVAETLGPAGRASDVGLHVENVEARARRLADVQPDYRSWGTLARTYRALGDLVSGPGAWERAIVLYRAGLERAEALRKRDATDAAAREVVPEIRSSLATALHGAGRPQEAVDSLERSVRDFSDLVQQDVKNGTAAWNLMITRTRLGGALTNLKRLDEAHEQLGAARAYVETYRAANPTLPNGDIHLAEILWEEGAIATARYNAIPADASREMRVAGLRTALGLCSQARDLLVGVEERGQLPAHQRANLEIFRRRIAEMSKVLVTLEAGPQ